MRHAFLLHDPAAVTTFVSRAQPGDVILFKGGGALANQAIQRYQRAYGFSQDACAYVHAALYIRGVEIVHAVPSSKSSTSSGVQSDDLAVYGIGSTVCLLRWPGMTPQLGATVVAKAAARRGDSYDYAGMFADAVWTSIRDRMGLLPSQGLRWRRYRQDQAHYRRMYCSGFVRRVFIDALGARGNPLVNGMTPSPFYTPADIYANVGMNTILVP